MDIYTELIETTDGLSVVLADMWYVWLIDGHLFWYFCLREAAPEEREHCCLPFTALNLIVFLIRFIARCVFLKKEKYQDSQLATQIPQARSEPLHW